MLLEQDNWRLGYHQIISDCRATTSINGITTGGTVLLLANPDADALCAARILSYALRADKVPYQLRPCGGFQRLKSILKKLSLNTRIDGNNDDDDDDDQSTDEGDDHGHNQACTIRAVVLLNLGATRNLQKALFEPTIITTGDGDGDGEIEEDTILQPLLNKNHTKLYILDSHRPYHLANVHAEKNIVLWNDFDHWHEEVPSDGDGLDGESDSDDSSDEDDDDDDSGDDDDSDSGHEINSDGEAEFEEDGMNAKAKKSSNLSSDESDTDNDEDDDSNSDSDIDIDSIRSKRRSQTPEPDRSGRKKSKLDHPETPDTLAMEDSDHTQNDSIESQEDESVHDGHQNNNGNNADAEAETSSKKPISMAERHKLRRNKIRKYYGSGTFHSSPVSHMAYTLLSTQLRHDTIGDLLWLACIGVTDAYLHNRLDLSGYAHLAIELQEKIELVYPDLRGDDRITERLANTVHAEELYVNDKDPNSLEGNGIANGPMTQVGYSENGRVMYQRDEFRFFLLRHTSLWDAMVLSPDLNTKMELWKSTGIQKLQEMLAKMGLPLAQCQQPYAFMKPSLKRRLKFMMMEHEEEYGLEHLKYTAFVRVSGYKSLLSASDMSLAVTALLECDTSQSQNIVGEGVEGKFSELDKEEEEEAALISSFNVAYDALNSNGSSSTFGVGGMALGGSTEGTDLSMIVNGGDVTGNSGLGAGIRLAIAVQKAIITTAVSLVERKAITRLSHFRYAYLHATSHGANGSTRFKGGKADDNKKQNAHHLFSKPLTLTKLAHYLMDMHRANGKWTGTRAQPLLLLAEKPQTQSYLVAGFDFPDVKGSMKNNTFGEKFELAANSMEGDFKFDSFDSHVAEVKGDVGRFIEQLHYMIDSV